MQPTQHCNRVVAFGGKYTDAYKKYDVVFDAEASVLVKCVCPRTDVVPCLRSMCVERGIKATEKIPGCSP